MKCFSFNLVIAVFLVAFTVGCEENDSKQERSPTLSKKSPPPRATLPEDYFPVEVGMTWNYEITVTDTEPLRYDETSWPMGDGMMIYANRGRFLPIIMGEDKRQFRLVIRSKALAPKQGLLEHPRGVELEIVVDELGIFDGASQVFWACTTGEKLEAILVVTIDPLAPYATSRGRPTRMGYREEGFSMRMMFFGERPGAQISFGKNSVDRLFYDGPVFDVEDYEGQRLLLFTRSVEGDNKEGSNDKLGAAFSEDMWYAEGKGLVRLEQKVGGKTTMIWRLREVSKDRPSDDE